MNRLKKTIFPLIFLVISLLVLSFALDIINFPADFSFDNFFKFDFLPVSNIEKHDNGQVIENLRNEILNNKTSILSENNTAVWYDMNTDLQPNDADNTESVKYAIYSDFLWLRNFVPDTIFIKPDTDKSFSHLKENNGTNFDALAYLLYYCKDIGCKAYLVADEALTFDENNKLTYQHIDKYLTDYAFSGVLLSVDDSYNTASYYDNTVFFSNHINKNYPDIIFGVEIHSNSEKFFADDYVTRIAEESLIDFGYVDCMTTTSDESFPFLSVALWWDAFGSYYNIPLICEHRADLIFSNDTTWGYSTELNLQLKALYNCPSFDGSCFYKASSLKNKKALARDLSIFLNDVSGVSQDTFSVESLSVSGNRATFTGSIVDEQYNLYCNDNRILVSDKRFEDSVKLLPGLNSFDFFSNGGKYNYEIYNNTDLIYSYNSEYMSDGLFVSYAICPDDSVVYVIVNGTAYQMVTTDSHSLTDIPDGYSVYAYSLGADQISSIKPDVSFMCSCNGIISVIDNGNKYTYLDNNYSSISALNDSGFGTALMCIIKNTNTEQISTVDDYDTYHPYKSALLKNTIDYVTNINVSDGGYLRYELKSGINVYGTDAVLINNAFSMPLNNIHFNSIQEAADKTELCFSKDWLSPITVTTKSSGFKKGYQQFSYNIDSFNLDYVDITFYYSENFILDKELVFSAESLFNRYELLKSSDNIILRLYLSNPSHFYGYNISENDNGIVTISFKNRANNSIAGKTVMLDAGHGGISMVGTALNDNSVSEATITLSIAMKTKQYLESLGAKVIMTRVSDIGLSLYERTVLCENANPDIFVSIHCDGSESLTESGTHTFYFKPYSQPLASSIHNRIVKAYSEKIYVEADENYENIDRKIKYYPFYVTRVDNCPSVLVETGFLTNYVEGNVLANPVNQDTIASAIANGISDYFYNY